MEVEHLLGAPARVTDTPIKDVTWPAGERKYEFVRGNVVVQVFEDYYQKPGMPSEHSSGAICVAVNGRGLPDRSTTTGRGLSLGDSVQAIKRLYGEAPRVRNHIQIHWSNGNILDVDLDSQGRVTQIELRLDES